MSLAAQLTCHDSLELLTEYLEGLLDEGDAEAFERHVVSCGACSVYYAQTRQTLALLATLHDEDAPPAAPSAALPNDTQSPAARYLKFLARGAVAPFARIAWPTPVGGRPGAWIEAAGDLRPCVRGVHACRSGDLPFWLADELWVVELSGELVEAERKVLARRGRLLARVSAWNGRFRAHFAGDCARRTRELAVDVLRRHGLDDEAAQLATATSAARVAKLERPFKTRLEHAKPRAWAAYLYAATAAELAKDPAGAATTAALAAHHAGASADAAEAERTRQADVLRVGLGLDRELDDA